MKLLKNVVEFILNNRRSGTTTLIKKIAEDNSCYVVVSDDEDIKREYTEIKDKCITLKNLVGMGIGDIRPILFTPEAVSEICNGAIAKIDKK